MPKLWDSDWERTPAPIRRRRGLGGTAAGPDDAPDPDGRRPPREGRRRLWLGALGALVLVAAGLVAGLALRDGGSGSSPAATELPAAGGPPLNPTSVGRIYDRVSAGVASVRTNEGSGTGFVIDANGTLVTNDHVVGADKQVEVRFEDGGDLLPARVVGTDPSSDLAVLKLVSKPSTALTVLPLANSDRVRVGDDAIAIGYPLGLARTATRGIISGLGREIQAPNGFQIDKVIQTDAPINPGNSGGPLLDARGTVIGVNSQIATAGASGSGNVGIGFAVPSNTVRQVVPILLRGGKVRRPFLGVSSASVTPLIAKALGADTQDGALVRQVTPGGPAALAGIRAADVAGRGGDIIVAVDGARVRDPQDVSRAIDGKSPGETVSIDVLRDGKRKTIEVKLGERPAAAGP
jgi:putative serine protease PepD